MNLVTTHVPSVGSEGASFRVRLHHVGGVRWTLSVQTHFRRYPRKSSVPLVLPSEPLSPVRVATIPRRTKENRGVGPDAARNAMGTVPVDHVDRAEYIALHLDRDVGMRDRMSSRTGRRTCRSARSSRVRPPTAGREHSRAPRGTLIRSAAASSSSARLLQRSRPSAWPPR